MTRRSCHWQAAFLVGFQIGVLGAGTGDLRKEQTLLRIDRSIQYILS